MELKIRQSSDKLIYMEILIADDDGTICHVLLRILTQAGHQVDEAGNGKEMLRIWKKKRHKVIFSDVNMPEKNGLEACQEILNLEPKTKIIMMTGSLESARLVHQSGLGISLRKPFSVAEVLEKLNKSLASRSCPA